MTWVLVVWFWVGSVNTAPTIVAIPTFGSEASCLKAGATIGSDLKRNTSSFSTSNLSISCVQKF